MASPRAASRAGASSSVVCRISPTVRSLSVKFCLRNSTEEGRTALFSARLSIRLISDFTASLRLLTFRISSRVSSRRFSSSLFLQLPVPTPFPHAVFLPIPPCLLVNSAHLLHSEFHLRNFRYPSIFSTHHVHCFQVSIRV